MGQLLLLLHRARLPKDVQERLKLRQFSGLEDLSKCDYRQTYGEQLVQDFVDMLADLVLSLAVVRFSTTVSDLGFMVDSQLSLSDHMYAALVTSNFFSHDRYDVR